MTLEKLLGLSATEWEALSTEELTKILEPYFKVTRPTKERIANVPKAGKSHSSGKVMGANELQQLMELAKNAAKKNNPN